ncbi:MAG: type I DNA topoisomerase [Parachlamydiales bacterium]|jgi:DNA topoisomerase-1
MGRSLIIVESPAKIKTLKKFLGPKYTIASSVGHIRDLPESEFGIDVEHGFKPKYVNLPEKKEVIEKLKKMAKEADMVYLCPDPDREGESIAWHIASILPKDIPHKRVTFNSITKKVVEEALQKPRSINHALVDAQQARRLLDRIVGYKISPILSKKIRRGKSGTSAGRVQSVALKFIVDREKEIEAFVPVEYWTIKAQLKGSKAKTFEAFLFSVDGEKIEKEGQGFLIANERQAEKLSARLKKADLSVEKVERKEKSRHPVPPFITSTLQQEAARHFGYAVSRTMSIAQSLYEGVDMGDEGTEGLITYMRTDSVQVTPEAVHSARAFIKKHFGEQYVPKEPRFYASKKSAQEAHEAIRPTSLDRPPEKLKRYLTTDQYKIYRLVWQRFLSSQMESAIYDTVSADITGSGLLLRANGSLIKFPGFLAVYEEKEDFLSDKENSALLPELKEKEKILLQEVSTTQSFTKAPPRYTEASLVKELEKSGIGRPSTYASIMNKIHSREYTSKDKNTLKPTELGKIIAAMLEENFPAIMNVGFTSAMEDDLELVAENKRDWKSLLKEFWDAFIPMVAKAEKTASVPKLKTDKKCPKCKKPLLKIWSKDKYFYGCSNYPDCDFTAPLESLEFKKEDYAEDFEWKQKCPKCGADMALKHGRFGPFLGCSNYPKCQGIVNIPKKGEKVVSLLDAPACPALGCDGKIIMRKTRFGKPFYSCSNYPDCDVVVNDPSELEKKYGSSHPKTAFVKRPKGERGVNRKYEVSEELAAIVGKEPLTRGEIIKKTWEYIKEHKLQNPKNRREIVPDEKLAKVFHSKSGIDMMKLSGILGSHIKR